MGSRILDAIDLPPCKQCGAWQGDPCRTPQYRITRPHRGRLPLVEKDDPEAQVQAAERGEKNA